MAKPKPFSLRSRAINAPEEVKQAAEPVSSPPVDKPATKAKKTRKKAVKKTKDSLTDDKPTIVRDGFTMPSFDYELIAQIQEDLAKMGVIFNKGEVLRAGINALAAMSDTQLKAASSKVIKVKTGRPSGSK